MNASNFFEDLTRPGPGDGIYYLVRLGGACSTASWQTSVGAENARDALLP